MRVEKARSDKSAGIARAVESWDNLGSMELPDWVKTPEGQPLSELKPVALRAIAKKVGAKFAPDAGHSAIAKAYAQRLREIYDAEGQRAVRVFLGGFA